MPPKVSRKKLRPAKAWSAADIRTLKKLAGKEPIMRIARTLKRSEAAVKSRRSSCSSRFACAPPAG